MIKFEQGEAQLVRARVVRKDLGEANEAAHLVNGLLELGANPKEGTLDAVQASELVQVFEGTEVGGAERAFFSFKNNVEQIVLHSL